MSKDKGVVDKTTNENEVEQAQEEQSKLEDQFLKELKGEPEKQDESDDSEDAESDESQEQEQDEDAGGDEESEESEESDEEESETQTGLQKRINELTAEKRRLESELNRAQNQKSKSSDPEIDRLEKMSTVELRELKREVRNTWKQEEDADKSRKLLEFEEKIDEVMQSAPQRFDRDQLTNFNTAVQETASQMKEAFTEDAQKRIFAKAKATYDAYPTLQKSVDGQAIAWQQAVDWYNEISKFTKNKEKSSELERDLNKLKKKVTLDTAVARGATKGNEQERLFKKAKSGDRRSEIEWVKKELNL